MIARFAFRESFCAVSWGTAERGETVRSTESDGTGTETVIFVAFAELVAFGGGELTVEA